MFDVFTSRPEMTIQLERTEFAPGEEVRGAVLVRSEKEREIDRGLVYLRCEEKYKYRERRRSGKSGTSIVTDTATVRLLDVERCFTDRTTLLGGYTAEHAFLLSIPQGAPPTYRGDILNLRWSVHAKLDLDQALDSQAEAELLVHRLPTGPYPQPRYAADSEHHGECSLALTLEGTAFREGESVCGVVHIEPRTAFGAQEIRLELQRTEHVPMHAGNTNCDTVATQTLASGLEMYADLPVELPFEIQLPAAFQPSVATGHGAVYWELDVIIARAWKSDLHLRKGIHVFTLLADE